MDETGRTAAASVANRSARNADIERDPHPMSKFFHLLSGGLDSTVLLYDLVSKYHQFSKVHCLLFDYGQRHIKELQFAAATCEKLGVLYERIYLPRQIFTRSTLTAGKIQRVDELNGGSSVVPNRNMVFLSIAASYALSSGGTAITWAANADDAEVFPDCRSEFYKALNSALRICDTRRMEIHAPYLSMTKMEIVKWGVELGVPLSETWSCYAGGETECGECGACKTRNAAMA